MQNSEEVVGVTLAKGVSNKHLGAMHLRGLLSHLWLGSHQQPPLNFALFLKSGVFGGIVILGVKKMTTI